MPHAMEDDVFVIAKDPGESIVLTVAKGATDLDGQLIDYPEFGLDGEDDSTVYILRKLNGREELYGEANNIEKLLATTKGTPIVLRSVSNRNVNMKFDDLKKKINKAKNEIGVFSHAEIFQS